MQYDNNFLGFNNFIWFNGVVEDRQDPQKLGRVRVRCLEKAITQDKAQCQRVTCLVAGGFATTSAGISGLVQSATFLLKGLGCLGILETVQIVKKRDIRYFARRQSCKCK